MDTISLLVYRRAHAAGPWLVLTGLLTLGLLLFGVAVLGLGVALPHHHADPLLAPFRWQPASSWNLA